MTRDRAADLRSRTEEVLLAFPQVVASRAEGHEQDQFEDRSRALTSAHIDSARLTGLLRPLVDAAELIGALVVISAGAWAVAEARITVGGLIAFLTYLTQLYSPVRDLTRFAAQSQKAVVGGERIAAVLDEAPLVTSGTRITSGPVRGRIALESVSVGYPDRSVSALTHVDLVFEPGTTTAIVGPSGSGKSTLASLLIRFMDPDTGRITMDGIDLRDRDLDQLRATVGLLTQETFLFRGTVADNVGYPRDVERETILSALKKARAVFDETDSSPERLLGRAGHGLSGGERRRVALARALLERPPVLVLDEFTNGLDAETSSEILKGLQEHSETIILITHDPVVASTAERVVTLTDGMVVDDHLQLVSKARW